MEKINDIITIVPFRLELLRSLVSDLPPANAAMTSPVVIGVDKIESFIADKAKLSMVEHPGDSSYILMNDHPSLSVKQVRSSSGTLYNIEVNATIEETFDALGGLNAINELRGDFCLLFMDADGTWKLSMPLPHTSRMETDDTTGENRVVGISFYSTSISAPVSLV